MICGKELLPKETRQGCGLAAICHRAQWQGPTRLSFGRDKSQEITRSYNTGNQCEFDEAYPRTTLIGIGHIGTSDESRGSNSAIAKEFPNFKQYPTFLALIGDMPLVDEYSG
eukprot:scaffold9009_cov23-Cyclotella_meneghiniana.AAC.1